jgi:hypothetical protein
MDKKVTRRVAIGTIIGGVVAAPVAYYFLKGGETAKPSGPKYQKAWANTVKLFDVPIKEIDGPATFTLNYRPKVGEKFRMISLYASYNERSYPDEYPEPPYIYDFTSGQVTAITSIVKDMPALLIRAEKQTSNGRDYHKDEPCGECIVVPRKDNDDVEYFEAGQGTPKKIPLEKVNYACMNLAVGLTCYYPKGKALTKGMKWSYPKTADYPFEEAPYEIAGFANVAGKETVKIVVDGHNNNQEIQDRINWRIGQSKEEKERTDLKRYLKSVIEDEQTREYHSTVYIEMKTGFNVRQEWRGTTHKPKAPKTDQISISINQALES